MFALWGLEIHVAAVYVRFRALSSVLMAVLAFVLFANSCPPLVPSLGFCVPRHWVWWIVSCQLLFAIIVRGGKCKHGGYHPLIPIMLERAGVDCLLCWVLLVGGHHRR